MIYKPLILFFIANSITQLPSILEPFNTNSSIYSLSIIADMLTIPAYLLLSPSLWLYVKRLTDEKPYQFRLQDGVHFIPCICAVIVCIILLIAPIDVRETLLGNGNKQHTTLMDVIGIVIMIFMIVWSLQVVFYVSVCIRQIITYRNRLKDIFANTEGKELNWIVVLMVLLGLSIVVFIPDFLVGFPNDLIFIPLILDLTLFWFLGIWALRQKPGFETLEDGLRVHSINGRKPLLNQSVNEKDDLQNAHAATLEYKSLSKKYQKSALTDIDMARIAKKINLSMQKDKLFLEPNLSLGLLSGHIRVPPNYVSQTLNAHIGASFFDYINKWRVTHTKPLLIDTSESVLNIAINTGFNSRSSYYKAFKRETLMTPIEYRKKNRIQQ